MANEDLAKQVMQALASGDRTRAAGLLRAAIERRRHRLSGLFGFARLE